MIKFLTNKLKCRYLLKTYLKLNTYKHGSSFTTFFFCGVLLVTLVSLLNSFFLLSFIRGYKKQCAAMIRVYAVFNIIKYNGIGEMIGWVLIKKIQFDIFVSTVMI